MPLVCRRQVRWVGLAAALAVAHGLPRSGSAEPAAGARRVPLEKVVGLLHSSAGNDIARQVLRQARAARLSGNASPFERQLLRHDKRLRKLDRQRHVFRNPQHPLNWQRWNARPLRQRAATTVLNTLGTALVTNEEAYIPHPVRGPARHVPYLDLNALERRLGPEAVRLVESLVAAEQPRRTAKDSLSWWSALNGVRPKLAAALSDLQSLKPYMPAMQWAVHNYGSLDGKVKGALVRWPLRGNTLALLADTGMPLHNTVVWADKDHFTDPRVAVATRKLDRRITVRGIKVDRDQRFIEQWISDNVGKLSVEEQRSARPLFLVSDDGGYLIKGVAKVFERRPDLRPYAHLFAGVEQTGSGSNKLSQMQLPFRVVNWARSEGKTYSGSVMWGYAIVAQTARNLQRLEQQGVQLRRDKAVVLGAGPMGQSVAQWLRYLGFEKIEMWDAKPELRQKYRLRDDKVEVTADADVVITVTGGNRALGPETLAAYDARHKQPRPQLWVAGGSPGEIGKLSAKRFRPDGLQTDQRGVLSALWNGRRVQIGRRTDGPDLDRFASHKGWQVVVLRDGHVVNGQSPVGGVRHSLFTNTGALYYGTQPLDPRSNDPVTGYAIQFELGMMHLAHLHALGLSNEKGAQPMAGNDKLVALPAGPGTRQHDMTFTALAKGTNVAIAEDVRSKGHFFIW